MNGPYTDGKMVTVPVDALGKSIDEDLVFDLVTRALSGAPLLTPAWVTAAARNFIEARDFESAMNLAAVALRWAQENRPR